MAHQECRDPALTILLHCCDDRNVKEMRRWLFWQVASLSSHNLLCLTPPSGTADDVSETDLRPFSCCSLSAVAQAPPTSPASRKSARGTRIQIGNTRIRLGGIDAPAVDQLCLNTKGERWTCGVAARDALIKHVGNKSWTCRTRAVDRRGRTVARCEVDGQDIQKWLVTNGWALAFVRISRDYEPDEKAAREAKAGMWQGAFIAPWDWRVRNKKTAILGATKPPESAKAILLASASGPSRRRPTAPSRATSTAPANASSTSRPAAGTQRSR